MFIIIITLNAKQILKELGPVGEKNDPNSEINWQRIWKHIAMEPKKSPNLESQKPTQ